MVTRMGHMVLRVPDLDEAVAFQRDILGMVENERSAGVTRAAVRVSEPDLAREER